MKSSKLKVLSAFPAAALIFGTAAVPIVPQASAEGASSVSPTAALPQLNDPAGQELIDLLQAAARAQKEVSMVDEVPELWRLEEAMHGAIETLGKLDASSAQKFAARNKLENAFDAYTAMQIGGKSDAERLLRLRIGEITGGSGGEVPDLTERERQILDLIDDTLARLNEAKDSRQEAIRIYREYLLAEAEIPDTEMPDANEYRARMQEQLDSAAGWLASLEEIAGRLGIDTRNKRENFEHSAAFMSALVNGSYDKEIYEIALRDLNEQRWTIQSGAYMADTLDGSRSMLDFPVGTQSGQYPASAIGKFKRAINIAERKLKTAETADELRYATFEIFVAQEELLASQKP